ncbi:MAG: MFS transporter [Gammaproteobacteria bacterium]|jgi:MFS family permease|nr:MFS transporter [Chromatiales bacterium]MDP6673884.1 MFS transporter [Gammaproteobacteria bacterium]
MQEQQPLKYPASGYAWYTVAMLTVAYIFSFIDRYILGLLVEPIKADMALTDTEIGLLLGPAFALFYTTMGLPLGWLADRARRTWIVAAGIAIWSIATAACGMAKNFLQLFSARVAVGVGEATLSPCALSMIADSFPPERRGKPVAFYSAALSVGAAIASLTGASVLIWSKSIDMVSLPILGNIAPWQLAFIVVGTPGIVIALLMLTIREPVRTDRKSLSGSTGSGFRDALRHIADRRRTFGGFTAIVCVMTVVAYSQGWMPAMFARTWGWEPERYALVNGIILLILGPLSVNLAGWSSDKLYARGHHDAPLLIVIIGVCILVPTGALIPLMPTAWAAIIVTAFNTTGIAILSATAPTVLLNITPGEVRGQIIAMYFIAISITGLLIGPTAIGLLNDYVFGENGIRYSAALVPLLIGLPVMATIRATRREYLKELTAIDNRASKADGY